MSIYIRQDIPDYLCFTANTAGSTIKLNKDGTPASLTLETSTDLSTWTTYTFWDTITLSNVWDKIYWRNTSETDTWFSIGWWNKYQFQMTWSIAWSWDICFLLNKNSTTTLTWESCFFSLFNSCPLTTPPKLPATTLTAKCYSQMFYGCPLIALPKFPATTLPDLCYYWMFTTCSTIKLSKTQTWDYQTPYRIPSEWDGTVGSNSLYDMFGYTWWSWKWTPTINTTYYTSNDVVW